MSHPARSSLRSIPTALVSSLSIICLLYSPHASAQNITTTPVPPLQWINLTNLLTGQAAPPLKDASIGYDDDKRNLVIFGGESSQGLAQSDTFLLNLDTLTWSSPNTLASLASIKPPARSAAISGEDRAVNYRRSHIVIGGKSADGSALNDVWEFDYSDEFWSQVTISGPQPSGRWGAAGGADLRTAFIQDPNLSWPNNSYYFSGGFDGKSPLPLSDVWRLNITGFLSSNNIDDVVGSWEQLSVSGGGVGNADLVGFAGAVVQHDDQQYIAAVGGCNGTNTASDSCAEGNLFILNTDTGIASSPAPCPAPRISGAIAVNQNTASASFDGQVFLLLGTFNSSLWNDGGGLDDGEVGILNVNTGAWSRVLPAGDPGTTGKPAFPSPREGAAVFSWSSALVGGSRTSATDTILFGGRDANGNYLSELWLLRAYNGVIQSSGEHWSGYGDGTLTTGTNATGAGVTVNFMTQCASAISAPSGTSTSSSSSETGSTSTSSSSGNQPSPTNSQAPSSTPISNPYDTSTTHKVLAPVSAALVFPAIVFYRLSQPYVTFNGQTSPKTGFFYLAGVAALASFALGIAGLVTAFTSLTHTAVSSIVKRSTPENLATAHGRAGLAFWIGLYGIVPILIVINLFVDRHNAANSQQPSRLRRASNEFAEKLGLYQHRGASPVPPPADTPPPTASTPRFHSRVRSWGGATLSRFSLGHGRHSSESAVVDGATSPSSNSFEVTNRPQRTRHYSGNSLAAFSDPRPSLSPHNLSDTSWMRRSPGPSGEHRGEPPSTPGTAVLETMSTNGLVDGSTPGHPVMPTPLKILTRTLLHAFLIGFCAITLAALWLRAPVAGFAVFLAWTVCSYILIFALAWYGIPRESMLSVVLFRLRTNPSHHVNPNGTATPHPPSSVALECFPNEGHGPYQHHQPPYRTAQDSEYPTSLSHAGHTVEDEYEDDEDEETRQRRIEDEMSRREVAIITTPKRRLVVKNPETS